MALTTPRRVLGALVALAAAVLAANVFVGRLVIAWDLTAERSATLSEETRRVLDGLDRRIDITAFFPRDAVGRVEAATLLSRYRKANRRITYRILDPALAPGEAERLGVSAVGSAAVQPAGDQEKIEIAQYTIEIDVTSAIARLLRGQAGTVCFATGHGEREAGDESSVGLSQAARLLEDNGYTTKDADLLAATTVPRDCEALVAAAPTSSLGEGAVEAIRGYLRRAGKAFVLADPGTDVDLTGIVEPWGIGFVSGIVVEADPNAHLPGDPTAPIVRRYAGASPAVRGLGPTFFPRVQGVEARRTRDPGLTVTEVATTSQLSYLDRRDVSSFDPDVDREGPVSVGAAADDSEVRDPGTSSARILRTRILAWGDVDFATNRFLGDASNARLWIQGIDWLTQPEALVTAVPNFPKVRELELTEARSRYMLLLTAAVVPGLFVIAGGMVWAVRRGR